MFYKEYYATAVGASEDDNDDDDVTFQLFSGDMCARCR